MQALEENKRLALLLDARRVSGLSLDFWYDFTDGLDQRSLEILVGRSAMLPKYMKSSGNL
jgi:hypothetical protein